jgi:hypothetical protein
MARRKVNGKEVTEITVIDPDTKLPVEVTIIKLETGGMIGIDSSFISQMDDEDEIYSPFDGGVAINLPE